MTLDAVTYDNHLLRMLGKPSHFNGEQKAWREWKFIFRSHVSTISPEMVVEMEAAATQLHLEILIGDSDENVAVRCRSLYTILSTLWTGDALPYLKTVTMGNGLQAWRDMVRRLESGLPGRQLGLLQLALTPKFDASNMIASIASWENTMREYASTSGEAIADSIKAAVMHRGPYRLTFR